MSRFEKLRKAFYLFPLLGALFAGCATKPPQQTTTPQETKVPAQTKPALQTKTYPQTKAPLRPLGGSAQDLQFVRRNQGYSLFYGLMSDEKNVSKLLLIKKEQSDVGDLIRDIARASGEIAKQLESFARADSHLFLKMPGLPIAEQQTRDLIGKTRAKELITKGGEKFEVRILLTQSEALTYGSHLAVIVQSMETDPGRKQFMSEASQKLAALHQRIIDLFHARWREPATK